MRFPSADPADESYVLELLNIFSIRQLQYLDLVQTGDNAEIHPRVRGGCAGQGSALRVSNASDD